MSENSFTEVTHQSWFSRIGNSIKGILVGVVLFVAAFPLLFWNEGRAVRRYKALKEGSAVVISAPCDKLNPENNSKLVHMSGTATTEETLSDPIFNVSDKAIKLKRHVEMYQWKESSKSKTEKKLGGGTETVTTYEYTKTWDDDVISSSGFKKPEGHDNPAGMPFESETINASDVKLGAYQLSPGLIDMISEFTNLDVSGVPKLKANVDKTVHVVNGGYYIGNNPTQPEIGDLKVSFKVVKPLQISIVSEQINDTFQPYQTQAGDGTIQLLQTGEVSAQAMFQTAQKQNVFMTWVIRVVGFIMMYLGISLIFKPLSVLADVLPLLGTIAETGIGLIAFLFASVFSLLTISIAWIIYRPLVGIVLLLATGGAVYGIKTVLKKKPKPAVGG
ncbi:MAG: TMEM43 family protein [Candidatus Aureabacteria bacterium]|nr:TMEM43 family protein [Candidatus Auribacterota bacterium]